MRETGCGEHSHHGAAGTRGRLRSRLARDPAIALVLAAAASLGAVSDTGARGPTADVAAAQSAAGDAAILRLFLDGPASAWKGTHLSVTMRAASGTGTIASRTLDAPEPPGARVVIPTTGLPPGAYALDVLLKDTDGVVRLQRTVRVPVLAALPDSARVVTVRPGDAMLMVRGRPFFPLGLFEAPASDDGLDRLARAGFNLCPLPPGATAGLGASLERLRAHGLEGFFDTGELLDLSTGAKDKGASLARLAAEAGSSPQFLFWLGPDEPVWNHRNVDRCFDGYLTLRTLDPYHPVYTNHAPRNTLAELARWNSGTDIAGVDVYPVPEPQVHSDQPDRTIAVVGAECDKCRETVAGEKPVFMVLQGFGWAELDAAPGRPVAAKLPTFEQSRFMAYDAIVHGANGLLWWGTDRTEKPSAFWNDLRSLVSELSALEGVLASPRAPDAIGASLISPGRGVRVATKRMTEGTFVFAVNETPDSLVAALRVPGFVGSSVRRLFEGGRLPVASGTVRVPLAGHGVAVLGDAEAFADRRADFSAEPRVPAASHPSPADAANLLANPGFESDRTGDGKPDNWQPSVPLATTLSPDAHTGRFALALAPAAGTPAPLAVQRGTPIRAGRSYHLEAWFRGPVGSEAQAYAEWVVNGVFHSQGTGWVAGDDTWRRIDCRVIGDPDPAGQAYVVVQARGTGTVRFDDVRLVEIAR